MGFLSCNSESSIIACDPSNCSSSSATRTVNNDIKKKKKKKSSASYKIRQFSYTDLETATDGFSSKCFLGKGSHGSVYKAVLNNGKLIVAVKRSTITTSSQEDNNNKKNKNDFCTVVVPGENEVEILARIQNPRFVNLLGYSFDSNENKLIVVEYMPNGSLYDILHSNTLRPLHWAKRVRFALQIARAVDALHSANPPVIHRDIKSSNVLIDGNWNARLGDFGLALRGYVEDVRIKCTPPAGTLGYLDPGYIVPEDLTAKSDVFSFGILLLEIVSGRNAIDMNYSPPSVVDWALPLIKHGEFVALCDPRIDPPDDLLVTQQLAMLAAKCVRSMAEKRPAMAEVVECLRIVNKSMSSPLWSSFRKQPVEESLLSIKEEMCDTGEGVVRTESHGYRTGSVMYDAGEEVVRTTENHGYRTGSLRNRIVSSIQLSLNVDFGKEITNKRVGIRVGRSNSIGSSSEIKLGSDTGLVNNQLALARVRRRSTVSVKMPYVKLYKSRSLGMLRSTCLDHSSERGFVLQLVKSPKLKGLDLSRLVRSVDETLETNIIEPKQST